MQYKDNINWEALPKNLSLQREEIHVYKTDLKCSVSKAECFYLTLSDDERKRADQYKFENDRIHFISARAILREIIGRYLALKPSEILFSYNSYGKPYLIHKILNFNLSHASYLAVYIFANSKQVGIDIEKIRPFPGFMNIAKRFFSEQENIDLHSIPGDQQLEAFFKCWTRKEAFIKAIGNGLSFPLNQFDVTLLPNEPARVRNINGKNESVDLWSMSSINPTPDHVGAFLFENNIKDTKISYFDW